MLRNVCSGELITTSMLNGLIDAVNDVLGTAQNVRCDYCARTQRRPVGGGCVGCGAALPSDLDTAINGLRARAVRVPDIPLDSVFK